VPKADRHFTFRKAAQTSGRSQLILKAKTEKALKAKTEENAALEEQAAQQKGRPGQVIVAPKPSDTKRQLPDPNK